METGDLLVLDVDQPGQFRRAQAQGDPGVVGIAAEEPATDADGQLLAPVIGAGFATVKADASYGPIRPGDLLTTSPTPGHAMLVLDPQPGAVVGKALEPLDVGTGLIKVLVMLR